THYVDGEAAVEVRRDLLVEAVSRHHVAEREDRPPQAGLDLVELPARRVASVADPLVPAVHAVDHEAQTSLRVVEIEIDEELALPLARLDRRLVEQPLPLGPAAD